MRILLGLLVAAGLFAQAPAEPKYEMDRYVIGWLKKGPKWSAERTPETAKIQEGHMANIKAMAAAGKLVVAGPLLDDGEVRGIFIFHNTTVEEARKLAEADPAIQTGRLVLELHPWMAAKGIKVDPPK